MSISYVVLIPSGIFLLFILQMALRRLKSHSIAHLPGPEGKSWLVGNISDLKRPAEIGDSDIKWTKDHGTAIRIKGTFGSDVLFTSDPKALQYILNASGYNFPKPQDMRVGAVLMSGIGLASVEGSQHSRQRKIMNPAFSFASLRGFLPLFRHTSQKMVIKLKEELQKDGNQSTVLDILPWMSRTTLDAIGAAGFDYQFGAIDQSGETKLSQAYNNLFADVFLDRSDSFLAFESFMGMIPEWMSSLLLRLPHPQLDRIHSYMSVSRDVAKEVVNKQTNIYVNGKEGSKDIMSILVRANLEENPKAKLTEEEVLSQLTTLFLAGHETTASTVTWALYELSRHPEYQNRVRDEIRTARVEAAQRGDTELTIADLDSMKCLLALMKETLRFYPIAPELFREAARDDIIPLALPVKTKTGEVVTNVPVSSGQQVIMSLVAYNRLKSVWGTDADKWRPERFLEGIGATQSTSVGVISNIITFSSGVRSCIGWRFAVIEMQAILIEVLESFEFFPPPSNIEIIKAATGLMTPMVKGSASRRSELPITVKLV